MSLPVGHIITDTRNEVAARAEEYMGKLTATYQEFLEGKIASAPSSGFEVAANDIHPSLFPHQRDAVLWALRGGRRALFESFGLGKTRQQLEILRQVARHESGKRALCMVVCPLGVMQEFKREATAIEMTTKYVRTDAEIEGATADVLLTNYERVRDGQISPETISRLTAVSLDEASVLRGYGTKTYQEFLPLFSEVQYRFVATATPSPNRYKELIHYAGFLGIADTGHLLTRFFQRDSTKANKLTLYPHREAEFWRWLSTWALFVTKPSDLGYPDDGYDLPPLNIHWHMLSTSHLEAGVDGWKQYKMFRDAAAGLQEAAREKRDTLGVRLDKAQEIMEAEPKPNNRPEHWIIWHHLERERHAIKKAIPEAITIYGSQDLEEREQQIIDFSEGRIRIIAPKPSIAGAGTNLQHHCARAIFLGLDYSFNDLIQSIHRIYRFQQDRPVEIHLIYTDSEQSIRRTLEEKWRKHDEMLEKMRAIIKEYGLSKAAIERDLARTIGCERKEVKGEFFTAVHADCVEEVGRMESNSVDLIHTSIPFGNHYEYAESYNDFGHNEDNARFFEQMDFLIPELHRVLKPGRVAAIHVKDRIRYGNVTGLGMSTVERFSDKTADAFERHGLVCFGRITVTTDVVRENNQTYRLGWSEMCKDGSKMGVGSPEYVMLFRRLPSDLSTSYADGPVTRSKKDYGRAQWQIDAHAHWRSSGDRLLRPEEIASMDLDRAKAWYRQYSDSNVYDYEKHVDMGRGLEEHGRLPATFMLFDPTSHRGDVWTDVDRMRTLNSEQSRKREMFHVCLAAGSRVLTKERGYVPIETVRVGEHALTHLGRWRPVLTVQRTGVHAVVEVKAQGVPGLTLTPDHNLWTRDVRKYDKKAGAARTVIPGWVAASDTAKSYINLKLPPVEPPSTPDETTWWTVGRWIADGHIDKRGSAIISVGRDKWEHFTKNIGRFGGTPPRQLTALQVALRDPGRELRIILETCGHGAKEKHLPPEAYTLPVVQARALLEGYLSGDGHFIEGRGTWHASSISRDLLLGIAVLAQRVHGAIASIYPGRPPRTGVIDGREVNMRQEWVLTFDLPRERRKQPLILDDGAWKKVRSVTIAGKAETWNLRIEEDESYTAEGCIVKNCPLQFDIVDRIINRYSNPGELVLDPFGGLGTVARQAVLAGRRGCTIELNEEYHRCAVGYCRQAEAGRAMPTLFDMLTTETAA